MTQPLPEGATQPQFDIGHHVEWNRLLVVSETDDGPLKITTMAWNSNRSVWVYDLEHPNGRLSPGVFEYELAGRWNPTWPLVDHLWRVIEDEAQRQLGLDVTVMGVVFQKGVEYALFIHCEGNINLRLGAEGDLTII